MPKINAERLIGDLKRLRQFGAKPPGVLRPAFSEADMEARKWLKDQYAMPLDFARDLLVRSRQGPQGWACRCIWC